MFTDPGQLMNTDVVELITFGALTCERPSQLEQHNYFRDLEEHMTL